jgi:HNH endonuclease
MSQQLTFDDLAAAQNERTVTTIAKVLTVDVARIAVRVTEFWRTVSIRGEDECWPWTGYLNEDGYGEFFFARKMHGAHELAVTFTTGEVKDPGLDTCHSCDNPPCCNPRHLRFGTRLENVADMIKRGRVRAGSAHPFAKLTEAAVVEIRVRRANGAMQKTLAADYGISEAYVSTIVNGLTWVRAGGPITGTSKRTTWRKAA